MTWKCDNCGKTDRGLMIPSYWSFVDIGRFHRVACNRTCLQSLVLDWLGYDVEGRFDDMWQDVKVDKNLL